MSTPGPLSPLVSASQGRSVYAELLRHTRGLSHDALKLREAWFASLLLSHKASVLFELEMLLKGIACFGSPRNHSRGTEQESISSRNFASHLRCVREGISRALELIELLLSESKTRPRRCKPNYSNAHAAPERGLFALRSELQKHSFVADGLLKQSHISFRLYFACVSLIADGIAHNPFFNPAPALEFCPEYDRIASAQMLGVLRSLEQSRIQSFAVLTSLSLFRALRCLTLLEAMSKHERWSDSLSFLILAVLRNDMRLLTEHVRTHIGEGLARELERDVMAVAAADIFARFEDLLVQHQKLSSEREIFVSLMLGLGMELRHVFLREIPSPGDAFMHENLRALLQGIVQRLKPAFQHALLFLGRSLGGKLDEQEVFPEPEHRLERAVRLRRDVWMFAQILRAFSSKARHADAIVDRWTAPAAFSFVRDFWLYFRALGYQLLWIAGYPRADAFLNAVRALKSADFVSRDRMESAILECENFYAFLRRMFDQLSRSEALVGIPFDRREAARTLRHYVTG